MIALALALLMTANPTRAAARRIDGGAFVQLLMDRHWEEAASQFDSSAEGTSTAIQIRNTWTQMIAQFGAVESVGAVDSGVEDGHPVDHVPVSFRRLALTLNVTFASSGKVLRMTVAPPSNAVEWRAPRYVDATRFTETPVVVGAQRLAGMVDVPNKPARFPMVVMLSGSGPNDLDETLPPVKVFKDLAQGLASRGIGTLRFEKRTHRGLPVTTVKEEYLDDVSAAIEQAALVPGVTKVVLLGHSLGAMLAPRIALGDPRVAGVIELAGSSWPYAQAMVRQLEYQKKLGFGGPHIDQLLTDARAEAKRIDDPLLRPDAQLRYGATGAYYLDLRAYDAVAATGRLRVPVFLGWGDRDLKVIPEDWAGWRAALGDRPNLTYRVYPGLQHMFTPVGTPEVEHVSPDVIADLADWIAKGP